MQKHIIVGLVLVLIGIVLGALVMRVRFGGDEDAWLCQEGIWVRHGNPSASMPTEPCPGATTSPGGVACTMEAKLCPDGSAVGRTGPNCEFAPCPQTRTISLFYYDPELDKDSAGNIQCSAEGLTAVQRSIAVTQTPIQDAVRLLLKGEMTDDERSRGVTSEFPLDGVTLTGASMVNGVLTLSFDDPRNKTGGGSCRVGILWAQISATAKQFEGVRDVRFTPEDLFQP